MDHLASKVPPSNLDAERAVLGAAMLEKDALNYVIESLAASDFYEPRHAKAFEVMVDMYEKGKAVDNITFREELQRLDLLDRLGGLSFIAMLVDCVTTTANVEHHCSIVRDKAIHRNLISVGSDIAQIGFSEDIDSPDALTEAERIVFEIAGKGAKSDFKKIGQVVTSYFNQLEQKIEEGPSANGVPSGFTEFDKLTGGFQPGSLNIIAARPSMGKTALALNIAQHAALSAGVNVLIYSLEMTAEQLVERLLSSEAKVNIKEKVSSGSIQQNEWTSLTNAAASLSSSSISIDDSSMLTTMELRSKCRRFISEHRGEKTIVIVDYLQLLSNPRKTESRQQEVSEISRSLKGVAMEFHVPVIALSQLSREVEKRGGDKRPMLSDLRDSGAIEQDADIVAFLYRPAYYQHDTESSDPSAELAIAKHRNGPTGKVDLVFLKQFSRFETMAYYDN